MVSLTNLQYEIRVPQRTIGEPQYTTALGMIFYGTDVMQGTFNQSFHSKALQLISPCFSVTVSIVVLSSCSFVVFSQILTISRIHAAAAVRGSVSGTFNLQPLF